MALESGKDAAGENYSKHGTSYEFESVIADLVDNSIDADANLVSVIMSDQEYPVGPARGVSENYKSGLPFLQGEHLFAIICDDGAGMDKETLENSIVYGRRRDYEEWELGHYGVGMKQSSMSQAYEMSIFTKTESNGFTFIRRSSSHVQATNKDEWLQEVDLTGDYAWMKETKGFRMAQSMMEDLEHGTVILLEGLHKLESRIDPNGRETDVDAIKTFVKNHLRLVFHYYIQPGGARIPLRSGAERSRSLEIEFNNTLLTELDPFHREYARDQFGTLQHTLSVSTKTPQGDMNSALKIWITPNPEHPLYPEVSTIEEDLKNSRRGLNRQLLQGIYTYRNMRLIDYGTGGWKEIRGNDPKQTSHRWELHLPPGAQIGDITQSDFLVNNTKSEVVPSTEFMTRLRDLNLALKKQWHPEDPKNKVSSFVRARFRLDKEGTGYLKRFQGKSKFFPVCKWCGSMDHESKMHKCPDCGRKNKCKNKTDTRCTKYVKPVEICSDCGEEGHANKFDSRCKLYEPSPPPTPPGQPPGGGGGGSGLPGPMGTPESDVIVEVTKTGKPITVSEVNGKTLVFLNLNHPSFSEIIKRAARGE